MAAYATYVGGGQFIYGIPARDLTAAQFNALTPAQQSIVRGIWLYQITDGTANDNALVHRSHAVVPVPSSGSPVPVLVSAANPSRAGLSLYNAGASPVAICKASETSLTNGIPLMPGKSWTDDLTTDAWYVIAPPNQATSIAVTSHITPTGVNAVAGTKTFFSVTLTQSTSAQQIRPSNGARKQIVIVNPRSDIVPGNVSSFALCDAGATSFAQGVPYAPGEGEDDTLADGAVYGIVPTGASVVVNGWEVSS